MAQIFQSGTESDDTSVHALSALTRQAISIYRQRLQSMLEPDSIGKGVAIHVASGDYAIAANPTLAGHMMRERHPEGGTATFRIGFPPEPDLAGRLSPVSRKSH